MDQVHLAQVRLSRVSGHPGAVLHRDPGVRVALHAKTGQQHHLPSDSLAEPVLTIPGHSHHHRLPTDHPEILPVTGPPEHATRPVPRRSTPGRRLAVVLPCGVTSPDAPVGALHHLELWVPHLGTAAPRWAWLLTGLGYQPFQSWEHGVSFRLGATYLVLEQSPALNGGGHDRRRPGLNHLAFHAGSRAHVDRLTSTAHEHGWQLLFADRHPHARGLEHYAAYLEDDDGYEVELVAHTGQVAKPDVGTGP